MQNYYITPDDYEIAELNGIGKKTLEYRIRSLGWNKRRAITEPSMRKHRKWIEIARKNGIKDQTYYARYAAGWEQEEAATTPIKKPIFTYCKKWMAIAEKNGINKDAFRGRIRMGWSNEKAATTPLKGRRMA